MGQLQSYNRLIEFETSWNRSQYITNYLHSQIRYKAKTTIKIVFFAACFSTTFVLTALNFCMLASGPLILNLAGACGSVNTWNAHMSPSQTGQQSISSPGSWVQLPSWRCTSSWRTRPRKAVGESNSGQEVVAPRPTWRSFLDTIPCLDPEPFHNLLVGPDCLLYSTKVSHILSWWD